jgi:hypothetical protein
MYYEIGFYSASRPPKIKSCLGQNHGHLHTHSHNLYHPSCKFVSTTRNHVVYDKFRNHHTSANGPCRLKLSLISVTKLGDSHRLKNEKCHVVEATTLIKINVLLN